MVEIVEKVMIEKRKDPRYKTHILIKYKRLDNPIATWQIEPQVKNISLGGMLFSAYEKMPVGTTLIFKIQIFVRDSIAKIIELQGKVVGVEDGIVSYDTRVVFNNIDKTTEVTLKKFINYIANSEIDI